MSTRYVPPAQLSPVGGWLVKHARWAVLVVAVLLCGGYLIGWSAWVEPRSGQARWTPPSGPTTITDENLTLTVLGLHRRTSMIDPSTGLETTPAAGVAVLEVELQASSPVELVSALSCRPKLADADHREWEATYQQVKDESGQNLPNDCTGGEPLGPAPVRYWLRYEIPARLADGVVGLAVVVRAGEIQVIAP